MDRFSLKDRFILPDYDDPTQMKTAKLFFDRKKCKQCGRCILLCPGGGILSDRATKMEMMAEKTSGRKCGLPYMDTVRPGITVCVACFDCGTACPSGAISIENHFNPGYYFKRLTQTSEMRYPKRY